MALTPPNDPESGDDILPWARAITKFVRQLSPRPSADIWPNVGTTGTSYQMRRRRTGGTSAGVSRTTPFQVRKVPPPEGQDPNSKGWFKVALYSCLSYGIHPKHKVEITELDVAKQLTLDEDERIWLRGDVSAMDDTPPGDITAKIGFGPNWNGDTGNFFPHPVEFNTDDGTSGGADGNPSGDKKQVAFYVPIAETIEHDPNDPFEPEGIMMSDTRKLCQLLDTHLLIAATCYESDDRSDQVKYVLPWWPHFYKTDDD